MTSNSRPSGPGAPELTWAAGRETLAGKGGLAMNRVRPLTMVFVLVLVVTGVAPALAGRAGEDAPPATVDGTVRLLDPQVGLVQLSDGTEFRVHDSRQLEGLKVGTPVRILYERRSGRNIVLTITPQTT